MGIQLSTDLFLLSADGFLQCHLLSAEFPQRILSSPELTDQLRLFSLCTEGERLDACLQSATLLDRLLILAPSCCCISRSPLCRDITSLQLRQHNS